jgi:sulfite exporter TauE/SafE
MQPTHELLGLMAEWQPTLIALWLSAFMAGLLGSGHCFAMCGGIAGSLGTKSLGKQRMAAAGSALQFNLGRISGYAIAGAVTALLLGSVGKLPGVQWFGICLRMLTVLLVMLIGFRYLFEWRGLDIIERWGAAVWSRIAPYAGRFASKPGAAGRLMLGLCWGFLPCGLVYTLLLTAASTGTAFAGATVMLAFGLGTLPSMLGLTLAAPTLSAILKDRDFRRFIGLSLVLLAIWMLFSIVSMGGFSLAVDGNTHHH